MHSFLKASDYPDKLLCSIRNDVFIKERDINYYRNCLTDKRFDVGWVTTFGPGYGEVKKLASRINRTIVTSSRYGPGQGFTHMLGLGFDQGCALCNLYNRMDYII